MVGNEISPLSKSNHTVYLGSSCFTCLSARSLLPRVLFLMSGLKYGIIEQGVAVPWQGGR